MRKRQIYIGVLLVIAVSLLVSGCAMKKSSPVGEETESDSQIYEGSDEIQGIVKYKSLIDKYVGDAGMPYRAYGEILKWYDYHDTIACMCPAEEWLDSEGKLRLPFNYTDIRSDGTVTSAYFYVPDELSVKASTGELADVSLLYASGCILLSFYDIEYSGFEFMVKNCNALEESLRRDDFAGEYLQRYLTYMADYNAVPKYYEYFDRNKEYSYARTAMLNFTGIILAQPESCEQLTKEQREILIREEIKRHKSPYESFFFACITGEYYMSDKSGECIWGKNPWLDVIKTMDLTEDEQKVIDKYFGSDK